jgi:hypothetical protein
MDRRLRCIIEMSKTMFHSASGRAHLFLLVRTHAQMQYYLNLSNSRRAANDSGLTAAGERPSGNVAEIHSLSRHLLA